MLHSARDDPDIESAYAHKATTIAALCDSELIVSSAASYRQDLQSGGRHHFTTAQATEAFGTKPTPDRPAVKKHADDRVEMRNRVVDETAVANRCGRR